jgi:hypothetical protein
MRVMEQFPLRDVAYSQDMDTEIWSERSVTLPPFDLSGYLRANAVHLAFATDLIRTFAIDSSGVWEVFEDGRVELAGRADLLRQIPDLGEDPRVAGIEETDYIPAPGAKSYRYLRIWSNTAAGDMNWSEDLLFVNKNVF